MFVFFGSRGAVFLGIFAGVVTAHGQECDD
jgi:hypothetical protein